MLSSMPANLERKLSMDKKEEKKQPEQIEKVEEKEIKIGKPMSRNMYMFNRYRQAYIPSYTR